MDKVEWPLIGMTVDECADALRIDRKTLFKALQDGLPARKVGRSWRIDPEAVKSWLATGNTGQYVDENDE